MRTTSLEAVGEAAERQFRLLAEIAAAFDAAGIPVWLRGGWALDFLLGRIRRDHADIDRVAWREDSDAISEALTSRRFRARPRGAGRRDRLRAGAARLPYGLGRLRGTAGARQARERAGHRDAVDGRSEDREVADGGGERGKKSRRDRAANQRAAKSRLHDGASLAEPHVQPHDASVGERAHLDEVAELVREPEPAAARVAERGALAPDERVVDAAGVPDLADDGVVVAPDVQRPLAAAVADRVRHDLVHREHEVGSPQRAQVGGVASHVPA